MPKQYSPEERARYCLLWQSSDLTLKKFCLENKISRAALYKWLEANNGCNQEKKLESSALQFMPVEPVKESKESEGVINGVIEIFLPNGLYVKQK